MIEKIVLDYLENTLNVPVYMEVPNKKPKRFILLEKTSGNIENYINSSTIAIQSYAESLYEASKLNEIVKEAMNNIIILDTISKSKLNSDYNYTDTTKKQYRYQAVYDLVFY